MKRILTILLIAISALASAQTYQLNYPDIRIGSSNTGKISLRGSNIQFPFLALGSTTDSVVVVNGGVIKKVPRSQFSGGGSNIFASNGLTKAGDTLKLGGEVNNDATLYSPDGRFSVNMGLTTTDSYFQSVNTSQNGSKFSFLESISYGNSLVNAAIGINTGGLNVSSLRFDNVNGILLEDRVFNKGITLKGVNFSNFTDSSLVTKKWVVDNFSGGGGAVSSVFGRTGAVTAQSADYNSFYPLLASTYNNPTWINTLAYSKITGVPSFITTETDPTVPAYAKTLTAFSVIKASTDPLYLPITYTPDTTVYRTVLNSFTKAQTNTQISNAIAAYTPASQVDNDLSASTTRAPSKTAVNTALALKENTANKQNSLTADGSGIKFPTVDAVNAGLATKGSGTVTSFGKTDGIGITSSVSNATTTPNHTIAVDTTTIRTVANSYTLAALQTKFNNYLTTANASTTYVPLVRAVSAGYGLSGGGALSANLTLTADTSILATKANTKTLAQLQTTFNTKQATLVSGTNIKTINGNTLLGSGDLVIGGGAPDTTVYRTVANSRSLAQTQTALNLKVDKTTTLIAGYGINTLGDLSTGRTVSVDTTSSTGLVSKSRLTASLGNFNVTSAFTGLGTVASPFDLALVSIAKGGTNNTTYTTGGLLKYDGTKFASALAADVPTLNQNTTGSAASLTTTRTIWGQNFNGTANVTGALSGATTIGASGIITGSSFTGAGTGLTGTAASLTAGNATKLATARTIGTTGITSTAASFDGSANVNIAVTAVPGSVVTGNITGSATGTTLEQVATANPNTTKTLSVFNVAKDNSLILNADIYSYPYIQGANQNQNATKVLLINPNGGNVLVGTTTDNTVDKLQVNGSISATNLSAGTYTPTGTITDVSGTVTSITPLLTHYSRIGNQVNVSGAVTFNTTTTSTSVTIELTLPIASNMTGGDDAWGTGTVPIPITNYSANSGVTANPTTDKAKVILNTLSGTFTLYYQYMYTIK